QAGTPEELYDTPASPFVAEFLGEINKLEGTVDRREENRLIISLGEAGSIRCESAKEFPAGSRLACYIRPEHISLAATGEAEEFENTLRATVTGESFYGSHTRYSVELAGGQTVTVPHRHAAEGNRTRVYQNNQAVFIRFSIKSVTVFPAEVVR
ncbi:MAG: TOBE domain-containing protein, partial [Nitrospinae bacterium]|nr:TOBE domain-containing protein [Nitrospinota bacterium]